MRVAAIFGLVALTTGAVAAPPQRIISMAPSATEILYGLGVMDRVVAVSDYDTWPPEVKNLPHIGGWSTPNLERVSALRPDLVVLTDAQDGLIGSQLRRFGVRVAVLPTQTLPDVYEAIRIAGEATGRAAEATRLLEETRAKVEAVRQRTRSLPHPSVLCVVDRTPGALRNVYVATDRSFLGELIAAAGGRLAAPAAPSGYARLSDEQLLALNPDIVVDIVQGPIRPGEDAEAVWRAFPELSAVRHHRIVPVHDQFISHASQFVAKTAELLEHIIHPEVRTGHRPHLSKLGFGPSQFGQQNVAGFVPVRREPALLAFRTGFRSRFAAEDEDSSQRSQFAQHLKPMGTWFRPTALAHRESMAYPVQFHVCWANLDSCGHRPVLPRWDRPLACPTSARNCTHDRMP